MIDLRNEPCDCPEGQCREFCYPASDCINRLTGDVRTIHCEVCDPGGQGGTWHQDGRCLRCEYLGRPA